MANAEAAASSSFGPRYAPEDPTLLKPWKGLIDGSTGLLYYWNPETNVTQYERPIPVNPPLPPGPPPMASAPKIALVPEVGSLPPNNSLTEQVKQNNTMVPVVGSLPSHVSLTEQLKQNNPMVQYPQSLSHQIASLNSQQFSYNQIQPVNQQSQQQYPPLQPNQQSRQQNPQLQSDQQSQEQYPQLHSNQLSQQQNPQLQSNQQSQQQNPQLLSNHQSQQRHSPLLQSHQQSQQQNPQLQSNQQSQQQHSQLQSNQIQCPPYFQGPLMAQTPVQGSQAPHKQQEVSQVPYLQSSHTPYQQQPQQQGPDAPVQRHQPLQGSQVALQPQPQRQTSPFRAYQQHEQLKVPIPSQIGQQPLVSQVPPHKEKQLESLQYAAFLPGRQGQLQQLPVNQQGHQIGVLKVESSLLQEGKQAGVSLPQVQLTGFRPSDNQLSGPMTQQQQIFSSQPSSDQEYSVLTSRGQHLGGLSVGGQQFNGPSSVVQQSGPSSAGHHLGGQSIGNELFGGQHVGVSSAQLQSIGPDPSYQQQMRSPLIPSPVGQSMVRPMGLPLRSEEDQRGRLGNDFLSSSRNEDKKMSSQLPKLAPLPQRWNVQDSQKSVADSHFISPAKLGELNLTAGNGMPDYYNMHPFPSSAPTRPPHRMFDMPELPEFSASDMFQQHHTVAKMNMQHVEVIPSEDKQRRLDEILRSHEWGTKIIIFCSTNRICDQLARDMGRVFGAVSIHGDRSRSEQDHALTQFRCGKGPILVVTDAAAREHDLRDSRVVINFDFPTAIEDYIQRIGRSAVSHTFFSHEDYKHAADLIVILEKANQRIPDELHAIAARNVSRWDSDSGSRWEPGGHRGNAMRGSYSGRGGVGRNDSFDGRVGVRGHRIGGPSACSRPGDLNHHDRGHDRGPRDRYYGHHDGRSRLDGGGRRGRLGERGHDQSYSHSPLKARPRGSDRRQRGTRSRSRSRSPRRSWSRSRSPSRSLSRSRSRSRSRSQSRSYERYARPRRKSLFSDAPGLPQEVAGQDPPRLAALVAVAGFDDVPRLSSDLSPMSPGRDNGALH